MNYSSQHSDVFSNSQYQKTPHKRKAQSRFFSIFSVASVIISLVLVFSGIYEKSAVKGSNDIAAVVENYVIPAENSYHYSQLDEYGKYIYQELLCQAPSGTAEFTIRNISKDDFEEFYKSRLSTVVYALTNDHPEFFWLGNGYTHVYNGSKKTLGLQLYQYEFWRKSTQKEDMISLYFSKIDEIVESAKEFDSDYEQIKFIHDYIIDNTVYDFDAAADNDDGQWSLENSYAFTSYGGVVNGLCVCGGYSEFFQIITQQLGYECIYISGQTPEGKHAWNMINLGGNYYYFDLTWDDVEHWKNDEGTQTFIDGCCYNHFAVRTEEFSKEHTDKDFEYPLCTATDYNYHYHDGYAIENYSEAKIISAVEDQLEKKLTDISLKFSDAETMDETYDFLLQNLNEILTSYGYHGKYHRYKDKEMLVLTYALAHEY